MEFVAVDVETANADMSTICQIGAVRYHDGELVDEWKTYVNPEDYFDGINVSIHGITEDTVKSAPVLPDISPKIGSLLNGRVTICHTHFDRVAIHQAFHKYKLAPIECNWLDSARIARRAWEQFARNGYGLSNVCEFLGYTFKPHDALEDAKAAAYIVNAAMKQSGLDLDGWMRRIKQPIGASGSGSAIRRNGDPQGPLCGEVLVFTGALQMPRREAADIAASIGCQVDAGVTKHTTLLIVGDQDIKKLAGHQKSAKHRKAENLIAQGQSIRILRETDFKQLVALAS